MWYAVASTTPLVHTTGINWASVLTIVGSMTAILATILTIMHYYQQKRDDARTASEKDLRTDFKDAIDNLGKILEAKLSTKDDVSTLKERVALLEGINRNAIRRPESDRG
jgi:hypothetical protein